MLAAARASQSASVPLAQPIAYGVERALAAAVSKDVTWGPRMKRWESHASAIACMTSSRMTANWREKSSIGTGWRGEIAEASVTWTWYNSSGRG